jgi:hypothetical protein
MLKSNRAEMMVLMTTIHVMMMMMIYHLPTIIYGYQSINNNNSSHANTSLIDVYDNAINLKDNATHVSTLWSQQQPHQKMIQSIEYTIIRPDVIKLHDHDKDVDIAQIPFVAVQTNDMYEFIEQSTTTTGTSLNSSSELSSASSLYDKFLHRSHHRSLLNTNYLPSTSRSLLIKTTDKHTMFKSITDSSQAMTDLLHFETWSTPHSWSSVAIFTCALSETYIFDNFLVSTIRRSGYSGDLVVVVLPDADSDFLDTLKLFKATVYTATLTCSKKKRKVDISCEFLGEHLPITLIRSFIYQYWALQYPDTTYIMMSDFRDVFFQSNPFTEKNKFNYWGPSAYDITFFAEHHPNRVISRCKHTSTTLNYCYGRSMTDQIGTSTVINNGVVFATRNASLIYVSFISIMTILHDYNTVDD